MMLFWLRQELKESARLSIRGEIFRFLYLSGSFASSLETVVSWLHQYSHKDEEDCRLNNSVLVLWVPPRLLFDVDVTILSCDLSRLITCPEYLLVIGCLKVTMISYQGQDTRPASLVMEDQASSWGHGIQLYHERRRNSLNLYRMNLEACKPWGFIKRTRNSTLFQEREKSRLT